LIRNHLAVVVGAVLVLHQNQFRVLRDLKDPRDLLVHPVSKDLKVSLD
jgi:hypothetical protein